MKQVLRASSRVLIVLLLGGSSLAQVTLGRDLKLSTAQGMLGAGYSDSYGNLSGSSHGVDLSADGEMDGYYYNPKFLAFTVHPYYGESRQNSNSQSISDSKGISVSSALAAGSPFPGSISYSKSYSSFGSFAVPGLADFTTHGNNQSLGIGWGVNLPGLPSLSLSFGKGNASDTVYGTNTEGHSSTQSFGVRSSYRIAGFGLGAGYNHTTSNVTTPEVLTQSKFDSKSGGDNYNLIGSHAIPLKGQLSVSYNHSESTYRSVYAGSTGNLMYQNASASASIHPLPKLNISTTTNYNDNIGGEYDQQILNQGGVLTNVSKLPSSYSISSVAIVTYQFSPDLNVGGNYQHTMQHWEGSDYSADYVAGNIGYARSIRRGTLNTNTSVALSMPNDGSTSVGFSNTCSYGRRFGAWDTNLSSSYSQNVQTLLVTYMTSSYSLTSSASRRLGKVSWFLSAGVAHSGLTTVKGDTAGSESYGTGISTGRWFTASGSYQRSHGISYLGASGLSSSSGIAPVLTSTFLYQFNGNSFSVAASSTPIPRLQLSASYSRSLSSTSDASAKSQNIYSQATTTFRYRVRKLNFVGGYSMLTQGFGGSGAQEANVSAFYVGITRWFSFF